MKYTIEFRPKALRDLKRLSPDVSRRIEIKLQLLCQDMTGEVKRLTNFIPGGGCEWAIGGCYSNRKLRG